MMQRISTRKKANTDSCDDTLKGKIGEILVLKALSTHLPTSVISWVIPLHFELFLHTELMLSVCQKLFIFCIKIYLQMRLSVQYSRCPNI